MVSLMKWFKKTASDVEVEEELGFHLDSLYEHFLDQGLSREDALQASQSRFGDVTQTKRECVEIGKRSRPFMRVLGLLFSLMFVAGVIVRVMRPDLYIAHLGDVLIMVAVSGRLLLYVRRLSPASFFSIDRARRPLNLVDRSEGPVTAYDDNKLTPTERVIFRKQ